MAKGIAMHMFPLQAELGEDRCVYLRRKRPDKRSSLPRLVNSVKERFG